METLLKKTTESILAVLVSLTISLTITPTAAFTEDITSQDIYSLSSPEAEVTNEGENASTAEESVAASNDFGSDDSGGSLMEHSLIVVDSDGNTPTFANGSWILVDGTYTISGTSQNSEGLRAAGNVVLNLSDAIIDHSFPNPDRYTTVETIAQYAPAINIESGNVRINLTGINTAVGAPGYAGIYVSRDATLVISGTGILNAIGGNAMPSLFNAYVPLPEKFGSGNLIGQYAGGAGIGGNGLWVEVDAYGNNQKEIAGYSPNFGTIQIDSGTINAMGGNLLEQGNLGAGAGIGAGGTSGGTGGYQAPDFLGTVRINGGKINAVGGNSSHWSASGGGAGIGTGGLTGNNDYCINDMVIQINGGEIIASGNADGAGIGGGNNISSGTIEITDGFITANGGGETKYPSCGGAGIGGGDGYWGYVWYISISGGTVNATGAGDAAGIGAGNDGLQWGTISISGSTNVTANGGSGRDGGNGINANEILVSGQAKIHAYSNKSAQGIVPGSGGLNITGITALWIQTEEKGRAAIPDLNNVHYSSPSTYLVTDWNYTTEPANPDTSYGWLNLPSSNLAGDKQFKYAWDENGLKIDGNLVALSVGAQPTDGSWAALYSEAYEVTVSYEYVGSDYPEEIAATLPSPSKTMSNAAFTAEKPTEVKGWRFDGWYTDEACTSMFANSAILGVNTTLYGRWQKNNGKPITLKPYGKSLSKLAQTGNTAIRCLICLMLTMICGAFALAVFAWHKRS